ECAVELRIIGAAYLCGVVFCRGDGTLRIVRVDGDFPARRGGDYYRRSAVGMVGRSYRSCLVAHRRTMRLRLPDRVPGVHPRNVGGVADPRRGAWSRHRD